MQVRAILLAAVLALAPLGARAADLVVWWDLGFYPEEDQAVRELVAAFEQKTGKTVELVFHAQAEILDKVGAVLEAGRPPDFLFASLGEQIIPQWAYEDHLADLTEPLGSLRDLFDPDTLDQATMLNGHTGVRTLYGLPMGRIGNYVHVWRSLLERAGFTLTDIPNEWEPFWSFWCDKVQPAVRKTIGRDDIWGIGLAMSAAAATDTQDELFQFQLAYGTPWLSREGWLQVDDPLVRAGLVRALDRYTAIWRQGCIPPDAVGWTNPDNNKAFLEQRVVMTVNSSLSIPAALRETRLDDYYKNTATIDWPDGVNGRPLIIFGITDRSVVFKAGGHIATATEFIRFLVEDGWLAHWLTFSADRRVPPMRKLIEQPFWLDPSDPHRMHAVMQTLTRPHQIPMIVRDREWRSGEVFQDNIWGKAVQRVAVENVSPEQAVDEAIARIKQLLSE